MLTENKKKEKHATIIKCTCIVRSSQLKKCVTRSENDHDGL